MVRDVFVGRESELEAFRRALDAAGTGSGFTLVVTGEPGMGKTWLVERCISLGKERGMRVLASAATQDSVRPFLIFSEALAPVTEAPLLAEHATVSFAAVFLSGPSGEVSAQAVSGEMDPGTIAKTLRAVQTFVADSFRSAEGHVGRMTYGDMTILAEKCAGGILCGVVVGRENPEMMREIRRSAAALGSGSSADAELSRLAAREFTVKRDISEIRLESERNILADRTVEVLASAVDRGPLVLVLEDMHWADEISLHVFGYLARSSPGSVVILASARPAESELWEGILGTLGAAEGFSELRLKSMDGAAVRELVDASFSPNRFPPEFYSELARACEGNPLFTVEMVAQMVADGGVNLADGTYVLVSESYAMPRKVEDIVMRRLESLDTTALALAEYCACLGPAFPRELLLSVTSVRDPGPGLVALERAGILEKQDDLVAFKHAMFREAIYNSIAAKWRSAHHRDIGGLYESFYEGREEEVVYELARHFANSGEQEKAFEYCLRAGEKAEGAIAFETAVEFFGWSLDALRTLKVPERTERELELLERLGDLKPLVSRFDDAAGSYTDALDLAGSGDLKARLHRKLAAIFWKIGRYDESLAETEKGEEVVESEAERVQLAIQRAYVFMRRSDFEGAITLCEELLERLGGIPDSEREAGYVMDILGSAHHALGNREKALKWYETALEIMENVGDLRKVAALNNNIGNIYGDRLQNETSKQYYDRAIEMFERLGDKLGVSVISNNIGAIHHSGGEPLKALECYERSLRIARAIGDQRMLSNGFGNLGATYSSLAEFRKTIEMFEKAAEVFGAMGDDGGRAWVLTGMGSSYHHLGDLDLGIRYMKEGNAILEGIGDQWKICPGLLYLAHALFEKATLDATPAGKTAVDHTILAEAESYFNRGLALAKELDSPDNVADALYGLANVKATQNDLTRALDLAKEAEAVARRANLRIELGNALRERAKLLALADKRTEAQQKFQEAGALYDQIISTANRAILLYEWGKANKAWGEKEKARELLSRAKEMFATSDMRLWVERVDSALEE